MFELIKKPLSKKEMLNKYLESTHLCHCDNPKIQELAHEITEDCRNEIEKAKKIYDYIKDNIKYAIFGSGAETKASKTLSIGYGDCGTKTNLHIALLRAIGIPARMSGVKVDISVVKELLLNFLYKMMSKSTNEDYHFWVECYISGKWISCDSIFDSELYEALLKTDKLSKEVIPIFDWNGVEDFIPLKNWIKTDLGVNPSWDDWLNVMRETFKVSKFIEKLMELIIAPLNHRHTNKIRKKLKNN